MIRVVCDTNLLISGLLYGGVPGKIYDAGMLEKFHFLRSIELLDELRHVLNYPKFSARIIKADLSVDDLVYNFASASHVVTPVYVPTDAVRDPKDIIVLAAVAGGKADYIVTGDKDLLTLTSYAAIPINTPVQFLDILA